MTEPSLHTHKGMTCITINNPILSLSHLSQLLALFERLASVESVRPLVVYSHHPRIFLAGAHLKEIASLDTSSCAAYARFGRLVITTLGNHPAPTVAAVNGACAGGGLDFALAFDSVVFSPQASFAHPGVKRGLVTGWGGTSSLPSAISRPAARRVFTEGSVLSGLAAADGGFLAVPAPQDLFEAAITEARRLGGLNPARMELWRSLKSGRFIDRFRATVVLNE
jgi:3-hydroxyacyl-CoA dehydrogenase/enoyl-CoA hydratase/3-hydroxybutyryl-CoA epimerase